MRRGLFICFTGIDGSGKTTLSKTLVNSLNGSGVRCNYVYSRMSPFILKPLIIVGRLIFLRHENMFDDYSEYTATKRRALRSHSVLSELYLRILWLDYLLQIIVKVRVPLILGRNLVCDRYVYDTVITDLSVDMDYSRKDVINQLDRALRFVPKPDMTFLVDVPEYIAYKRKNDVPSVAYLEERRSVYLDIAAKWNLAVLDGTRDLEDLGSLIQGQVKRYLNSEPVR